MKTNHQTLVSVDTAHIGVRQRRGFVLLMSLVLIALAGMMLAGLARHRLTMAVDTQMATVDLQRRWGITFAARALLAHPEQILEQHLAPDLPASEQLPLVGRLRLGTLTLRIVLDDENRKLNLNRLHAATDTRTVLDVLRRSMRRGELVDLRPLPGNLLGVRAFDSWGHVLRFESTPQAEEIYTQVQPLADLATCWGDAKVNLHRCTDDVLYQVGVVAAGPITARHLVSLRHREPQLDAEPLLTRLEVNRRKRALLQGWLTDASQCHSLWILATDQRTTCDFYVRESTGSDSAIVKRFRW